MTDIDRDKSDDEDDDSPSQLQEAWATFMPRPDQPERFDEQSAFYNSKLRGVAFLIGGNGAGCLAAEQPVYDPVKNREIPVSEIDGPFHVWARNNSGQVVIAQANKPKIYGVADLYEISLSSGRKFTATGEHRVLTAGGYWREIRELHAAPELLESNDVSCVRSLLQLSSTPEEQCADASRAVQLSHRKTGGYQRTIFSEDRSATNQFASWRPRFDTHLFAMPERGLSSSRRCASRSYQIVVGFLRRCLTDRRLCDAQPQSVSGIDQETFPSQGDVLGRILFSSRAGGLGDERECIRACRSLFRHSKIRCGFRERRDREEECAFLESCLRSSGPVGTRVLSFLSSTPANHQTPECQRFLAGISRSGTCGSCFQSATASCSDEALQISREDAQNSGVYITAIHFLRRDSYWDFSVEEHENYWLAGIWHHNTTECCVAKAAKFMLWDQIAPRKDTPFWCIAESYEQVCNALWKEKFFGHGHIPYDDIDWERIRWYRPNQNWPFEVPLKPRPQSPGTNWTIKFKSYAQGRQQMQAESIGGFFFSEQFPWGILEEVVRGCREYSFRGAKMAEFTPVDPLLSVELEERIAQNKMPKGWHVFRANTTCAMEAGHVSKSWYEEFFGLVPDEMRAVREIGAFATFAGAIYPSLNPSIHFLPDDWEMPPACHHRRAIDWGFGPDNAFVCLWGCRDGVGRWYIYDEYYSTDQGRTIHDHLKIIADRWPWPNKHFYGCTYADPSEPGNLRIASRFSEYQEGYENFDIQGASNAVYEGIEHVRWLLKYQESMESPRLMVHKASCPNLCRELRTYRWEKGTNNSVNPRDARPVPLKRDDHAVDAMRYMLFSEANKSGITPQAKRRERDAGRYGIQLGRTGR